MTEQEILDQLEKIQLRQVGWEGNEDVMTFNGEPIGATFSNRLEIDRWWPSLKRELAKFLSSVT
jgi:hypothetical protein